MTRRIIRFTEYIDTSYPNIQIGKGDELKREGDRTRSLKLSNTFSKRS